MLGQAALAGQIMDDFPGQLARRGMGVLPAVHGGDGDSDLVRKLFLRESELLPKATDHGSLLWAHCLSSPSGRCFSPRRKVQPACHERAFGARRGCGRQRSMFRGSMGALRLTVAGAVSALALEPCSA